MLKGNFKLFRLTFLIVIAVAFSFCSKSDDQEIDLTPADKVFIRVENTSLVDFMNVKVRPDASSQLVKETGVVLPAQKSDYLGFVVCSESPTFDIKFNDYYSAGLSLNSNKRLEPGKYTLKLFVPNKGQINITSSLVKD